MTDIQRELDVSLKLGKEAECKDKALGTVINRWLGKFHISQQNLSLPCNLAKDFQTGKGLLTKGWKSRKCGHSAAPSSRRTESCLSLVLTEILFPNICAGHWTTSDPLPFPFACPSHIAFSEGAELTVPQIRAEAAL